MRKVGKSKMNLKTKIIRIETITDSSENNAEPADLAVSATETVLKNLNWRKEDIRVLIYGTQSPKFLTPSTASYIFKNLGMSFDCITYDIDLGVTAFSNGIQLVSVLLESFGVGEKGILILGEEDSKNDLGLGKYNSVASVIALESSDDFYNETFSITHSAFYSIITRKERDQKLNYNRFDYIKNLQNYIDKICIDNIKHENGKGAFIINFEDAFSDEIKYILSNEHIEYIKHNYDGCIASAMVPLSIFPECVNKFDYLYICTIGAGANVTFAKISLKNAHFSLSSI